MNPRGTHRTVSEQESFESFHWKHPSCFIQNSSRTEWGWWKKTHLFPNWSACVSFEKRAMILVSPFIIEFSGTNLAQSVVDVKMTQLIMKAKNNPFQNRTPWGNWEEPDAIGYCWHVAAREGTNQLCHWEHWVKSFVLHARCILSWLTRVVRD